VRIFFIVIIFLTWYYSHPYHHYQAINVTTDRAQAFRKDTHKENGPLPTARAHCGWFLELRWQISQKKSMYLYKEMLSRIINFLCQLILFHEEINKLYGANWADNTNWKWQNTQKAFTIIKFLQQLAKKKSICELILIHARMKSL
jgi:hypothetical protein